MSNRLSSIQELNGSVQIAGFSGPDDIVTRLQEMGFRLGLQCKFVGRAPFGGPFLYRFGSTVVALREEEAACLLVER